MKKYELEYWIHNPTVKSVTTLEADCASAAMSNLMSDQPILKRKPARIIRCTPLKELT